MEKGNVLLETKNLVKSYSTGEIETTILNNIDLKVYEGDFTVIMGSSGSGKSTLLYSISGMDAITSGSIKYLGNKISSISEDKLAILRREKMGFIFQQMNLMPSLTIAENIELPAYLVKGNKRKKIHEVAEKLMATFEIKTLKNRFPNQVSGGQMQRAAIARALVNSPELIFADEPTGALNSSSGLKVLDMLTKCSQSDQNILMVTHDIKAALRANRIIYLNDGTVKGEIELEPFNKKLDLFSREQQILIWLQEMGW